MLILNWNPVETYPRDQQIEFINQLEGIASVVGSKSIDYYKVSLGEGSFNSGQFLPKCRNVSPSFLNIPGNYNAGIFFLSEVVR